MKKGISIVLLLMLLCSCYNTQKKEKVSETTYNTDSTTVKLEGIITDVKNDCWNDGTCSIEVDNKWWVAITYGKRNPSRIPKERGKKNIQFTEDNKSLGKKVKIYAKIKKGNKLTVEGSNAYYALIIE